MAAVSTVIAGIAAATAVYGAVSSDQNAKSAKFAQKTQIRRADQAQDKLDQKLNQQKINEEQQAAFRIKRAQMGQSQNVPGGYQFGSNSGMTLASAGSRRRTLGA